MTWRLLRRAAWFTATLATICAALLAWSIAKPSWISRGHMTAGLTRGQVEVAWGSGKIVREPNLWVIKNSQGYANILLGPRSAWRPSTSDASMGVGSGPGGGPLFRLTALFIPLWPLTLLSGGGTGILWWRSRRVTIPGHCRKCEYNLVGLVGQKCPECGTPSAGIVARIIQAITPTMTAAEHRPFRLGITR